MAARIFKELGDNGVDSCEEAGIAPSIAVTVDKTGIKMADNGPGIPAETVEHILDFTVRVSSREAYVSPTRGAQGNALKTIVAMPFVLDGERGEIEIEARGVRHRIVMSVDRIRQEPVIRHERAEFAVRVGTVVRVPWPDLSKAEIAEDEEEDEDLPRSIVDAKSRFLQIASDYTWLNPHLTLSLDWFGERTSIEATDPTWSKWKPSEPTSPHWYTATHLERLIGGYIAHDADGGRGRTVRELVAEFRGLSGTAKQKSVLDATGLARAPLSALIRGNGFDRGKIEKLLAAMKANSAPVKPAMLGSIGKEHFRKRFSAAGCEMETFDYRRVTQVEDDVPWIVETAFAWCPDGEGASPGHRRQLVARHRQPVPRTGRVRHELGHDPDQGAGRHRRPGNPDPAYRLPARRVHRPRQERSGSIMISKAVIDAITGVCPSGGCQAASTGLSLASLPQASDDQTDGNAGRGCVAHFIFFSGGSLAAVLSHLVLASSASRAGLHWGLVRCV